MSIHSVIYITLSTLYVLHYFNLHKYFIGCDFSISFPPCMCRNFPPTVIIGHMCPEKNCLNIFHLEPLLIYLPFPNPFRDLFLK